MGASLHLRDAARRGLVMLGCGRMGGAILQGWLANGLPAACMRVIEPNPSEELRRSGVALDGPSPADPAAVILAVKPQMMAAALPQVAPLAREQTLFLSIAAGLPLAWFEARLAAGTPIIRAMPNTPAAIGLGVTALVGNERGADEMPLAEALLDVVGETVTLPDEAMINAVTGVSGSGPAYVFHMIEALSAAGQAEGLPPTLADKLARATVCGAGALARHAEDDSPSALRAAVTSPGGTTEAALAVLMDQNAGLPPLMRRAVAAAVARSKDLASE